VRLAILLSFAALGVTLYGDLIDDRFVRVDLETLTGYIVPESYAEAHKTDLTANIPATVKIEGFWTPSVQDVTVADRVFRERIESAAKDPALLFPGLAKKAAADAYDREDNLEYQQKELEAISANFDTYARQYIGIIMGKKKLIFCNYSVGTKVDPSAEYIFTDKVFVPDGTVHFLQCRFEPEKKTCSNVSMIGSWQVPGK
jgi:hypothetical protein